MFAQKTPIAAISRNDDQMDLFAVHVVGRVYSASWNGQLHDWFLQWRDWFLVGRKEEVSEYLLDSTATGDTPAHAFASHKVRASSIARQFALNMPLQIESNTATEDNTIQLIAHLQAGSDDPSFSCPGQEPSVSLAPKMLRNLYTHILHQCIDTRFGSKLILKPAPEQPVNLVYSRPLSVAS